MARAPSLHPTDGELEILQILWQNGASGLGEICAALREKREAATTTVATMLKVMLDKGLVHRKPGPQGYLWSAKATRQSAASGILSKVIDLVFDGSARRLVTHLVESGKINKEEREELRRLMEDAGKKRK